MGNGKTTLRDVAAAAGVSPMTASNALHGKPGVKESTRQKVIEAAERLDYRINLTASMLKSGRSNIIHIIINEFDSPFYSKLVQSLANETTARGLTPFVEQTQYSPAAAKQAMSANPFSGQLFDGEIIHASGLGTNLPLAKMNAGRPLVLIDGCEETPSVDTVNFPNEEGARAAVQHLIERGCKHIAIVGGGYIPRAELAHAEHSYDLRLRGASGALLDAGLPYDESMTFCGYNSEDGIDAGHRIADEILAARANESDHVAAGDGVANTANVSRENIANVSHETSRGTAADLKRDGSATAFDGVFCSNDYAAFGVIRGLADRGIRVPDDVKVIGIDGTSFGSYATPTLSTIQVDLDQLAQFALDMITRRIEERARSEDATAPTRATIGYQLVARESTGGRSV
ncbi:LacI family DNA-binding transcriptional regulator [Bifidobacterium sp. SO1]|uniref:LacI family DNA-binding transcriptional regulator n=1 Tax=Bifidobacterium sp. SO1 TaxID=2809029 RepID=UPI001BDCF36E|nr:LacI family DNA-binding transcriptional regulator [Bifidobacterium sp. SO1]MBT1161886.1 LacI family DNA-binding transcriptional regulator [Bifidobacterium sp. SO1]